MAISKRLRGPLLPALVAVLAFGIWPGDLGQPSSHHQQEKAGTGSSSYR